MVASKVESLRINNDLENTVRVYDKGTIGVDGRLGNADFSEMETAAKTKLAQGIAYPETHEEAKTISIDTTKQIFGEKTLFRKCRLYSAVLQKKIPNFCLATKLCLTVRKRYTKTATAPRFRTRETNSC